MLIAGFPAGSFQANCYVLAVDAGGPCVVVDPGQDAMAGLQQLLTEHRLDPVAVILTHGHLDHTASTGEICRWADIPAYIHPADEYMLSDPLAALSPELQSLLAGMSMDGLRPPKVIGVQDGVDPMLADLPLTIDHIPGHTGGSIAIRVAGDDGRPEVLLTGDTLFAGSIGRTDLPGGSTPQQLVSIQDRLLSRPDNTVVLPGHGPSTTIGEERAGNPFLTPAALARAQQAAGRSDPH